MQKGPECMAVGVPLHAKYCMTLRDPTRYHHRQRKVVHLGTMKADNRKIGN